MADPIQPHNPKFLSEIKTYESCLGKGGFGIVLKAVDTSDTSTAIKFIFLDPYNYSDREKLLREYNVPKKLRPHPNIVQIINVQKEAFSSANIEEIFKGIPAINDTLRTQYIARANARYDKKLETFCIQMELCGENLRNWLNVKHNPNDLHIKIRQTKIIQGMISGLKYLHDNKIIHRDLKPENIMFSKGRYLLPVKIGDFGHSREETETGSMTSGVGTRTYRAPEVSHGDHYDHQADLYSLGLIIWEVSQLIEVSSIRKFFDNLVNGKEEELVQDHPIMKGIKEIIIGLTKRKTSERTKSLNDIDIDIWDQELLKEVENDSCSALWESILNSEKNLIAKTSQELKLCLDNTQPGCIINLADGEYLGPFFVVEDGVQIVGNGPGTVMHSNDSNCLEIIGSECTISNLKISRSDSGIKIQGSHNTVNHIELNDIMKEGIMILGSQNTVDDVTMTNVEDTGIWIRSNENSISNITGLNMMLGIRVSSSNNNLVNIKFQRGTGDESSIGVTLGRSSYTKISNVICTGYSMDKGDWGLKLSSFSWILSNCIVVDSVCGPVRVIGFDNVALKNVDCGELISVEGSEGVELINCRGKKLEAPISVKVSNCQFEEKINYKTNHPHQTSIKNFN